MKADFSSNTVQESRKQSGIFKILKEKSCQTRIPHPGKIFFKNNEGKIDIFKRTNLKVLVIQKYTLQELNKVLQAEKKERNMDLNIRMKNIRNGNYMGKYLGFFLLFKYL